MGGSGGARAGTWAEEIAASFAGAFEAPFPDDVLERAALQVFDSIACAAGAQRGAPVMAAHRATSGSGPGESTLWFRGSRANLGDAVLVNGTAVRYLDANDVFLGRGPGGHPSDTIPVAVAAAEAGGCSGRDLLAAVALSYELIGRLRQHVYRIAPRGADWHEVSISGPVAAVVTALLSGASSSELANALAIGASRGYALKEIRRGHISMLKAAASASAAREGVMAARLAMSGMSGPLEVFEGESGLLATLGGDADPDVLEAMCAPPDWLIRNVSIKPVAALGTSQAALAAASRIRHGRGSIHSSEVERVTVLLPDTPYTREYIHLEDRWAPRTRGSADHSIQFLVAAMLLDGQVSHEQYEHERWLDQDVRRVMSLTTIDADAGLNSHAVRAFPSAVEVRFADGTEASHRVLRPPGSPDDPWGWPQVREKFARLQRVDRTPDQLQDLVHTLRMLAKATALDDLQRVLP